LVDYFLGPEYNEAIAGLFSALFLLMLFGCLRNTLWAPFIVPIDNCNTILSPALRFVISPEPDFMAYVADATICGLFVHPIAMVAWRCAFHILEVSVSPDIKVLQYTTCLIFGIVGTLILFSIQGPLGDHSARLEKQDRPHAKILYENFIHVLVFFVMTPLWFGAWNLNATFLIKDDCVGGWVHHIAGSIGLLMTHTFSYVAAWGVVRDGSTAGGGAFFVTQYFRYYRDLYQQNKDYSTTATIGYSESLNYDDSLRSVHTNSYNSH